MYAKSSDFFALNKTPSIDEKYLFPVLTLINNLPQEEKQVLPREVRVEGRVIEVREEHL